MRYYRFMWRKYARKLLNLKGHPKEIAKGFAYGIFVGFTPTFGFQMVLILALNTFMRVNKLSGLVAVQISNFFTALPIYIFNYWVGSLFMPNAEDLTAERLREVMAQSFFWFDSFSEWGLNREAIKVWWQFMFDMGGPLWLGSILVGILMGFLSYKPTLWAVERYRRAIVLRREIRHLRIMARKEHEAQAKRMAEEAEA